MLQRSESFAAEHVLVMVGLHRHTQDTLRKRAHFAPWTACSVTCSVRLTTGAPWGTQARCRWADPPVPAGLQALLDARVFQITLPCVSKREVATCKQQTAAVEHK